MSATRDVRIIPWGQAACTVCDEPVPLARSKARLREPVPLYVHGPRGARCPGGGLPGKSWVEGCRLPTWDEMSDLDRGCALLFVWKVYWEHDYAYAREHYPCRYRDDAALSVLLSVSDACRHARAVTGGHLAIQARLGDAEWQRLYDLALDADQPAPSPRQEGESR